SRRGERIFSAREFFHRAMQTALLPDELLAEARLSLLPPDARFGFAEFSRRVGDYAMAMAMAVMRIEGGIIAAPRLGIGGAEAAPRRLASVEAVLAGAAPNEATFRAAANAAVATIDPLTDGQTDARYRRELVGAMVYRALTRAAAQETEA